MVQSDIKLAFVESSHRHISKVRNCLSVHYVGLRIELHQREPSRIDGGVDRRVEHIRGDFVTRACRLVERHRGRLEGGLARGHIEMGRT